MEIKMELFNIKSASAKIECDNKKKKSKSKSSAAARNSFLKFMIAILEFKAWEIQDTLFELIDFSFANFSFSSILLQPQTDSAG